MQIGNRVVREVREVRKVSVILTIILTALIIISSSSIGLTAISKPSIATPQDQLVDVVPDNAQAGQSLQCLTADQGIFYYYWYKDGVLQPYTGNNVPESITHAGEVWLCEVYIPGIPPDFTPIFYGSDSVVVQEQDIGFNSIQVTATPSNGEEPLNVQLSCITTGGNPPILLAWDFENDGVIDTEFSKTNGIRTHTYSEGSYNARCIAIDNDGDSIQGLSNPITVSCHDLDNDGVCDYDEIPFESVTVTAMPDQGIEPLTTTLTCDAVGGNPPLTYAWDFENDGVIDTEALPSNQIQYTYNEGTYNARCVVFDSDNDFTTGLSNIISVEEDKPITFAEAIAIPTQGYDPLNVLLQCYALGGNQPLKYAWDFENDGVIDTDFLLQNNELHHIYHEGTYTARCIVKDANNDQVYPDTDPITVVGDIGFENITINANPTQGYAPLTVSFSCSAIGGNPPISYSWDFGDGFIGNNQETTHTYIEAGNYTASCKAIDVDGDMITGYVAITVLEQPVNQPPIGDIDMLQWNEDEVLTVDLDDYYQDPEGQSLIYQIVQQPTHITASIQQNILTLTPEQNWNGNDSITITISDGVNQITDQITLIVNPVNDAPILQQIPGQTIVQGQEFQPIILSQYVTDIDNTFNELSWTLISQNIDVTIINGVAYLTYPYSWHGSENITFIATDPLGANDTTTATFTVLQSGGGIPQVTLTATPNNGEEPLIVNLTCNVVGGDPPFIYTISFGDGSGFNITSYNYQISISHTYNAGTYLARCIVIDIDADMGYDEATINVTEQAQQPIAYFDYHPEQPVVNETIIFNASQSYDEDGFIVSYSWDFGDGQGLVTQQPITIHAYETIGNYTIILTVRDNQGLSGSYSRNIVVTQPENISSLQVANITCFKHVIINHEQVCSITIVDENNNSVENAVAQVVYYPNGELFDQCWTNNLGKCIATRVENSFGNKTLYARAIKPGFNPDMDTNPRFNFTVLNERYEIRDLTTYNDSSFENQDNTFYRGESLYVQFRLYDLFTHQYITDNIITEAELVSQAGGIASLQELPQQQEFYRYSLDIPSTHDFYGDSQIFAFAFNFTDQSGGEVFVNLTIMNNPPVITLPNSLDMQVGDVLTINLDEHVSDLEDEDSLLSWVLGIDGNSVNAYLQNTQHHELIIQALQQGVSVLNLTVYDLDNDFDNALITVTVFELNHPPVAYFTYQPTQPVVNETIIFNASQSYDEDGFIVSYSWDFGDGQGLVTQQPITTHTYQEVGNYTATLTVIDNQNLNNTYSRIVEVKQPINQPPIGDIDMLQWNEDEVLTVDLDDYYQDPEGQSLIYQIVQQPTHITASIQQNILTLTPEQNWNGNDSITITISDGVNQITDQITLIVNPVNDAPIVEIIQPNNGASFYVNQNFILQGTAFDVEQGLLPNESLRWYYRNQAAVDSRWKFIGTGNNINFSLTSPGIYDITLTASDDEGLTGKDMITINILGAPLLVANANGPYYGRVGEAILFNATASVGVLTYTWDFGDGNVVTTKSPYIIHIYNYYGYYTVKLTVSNGFATAIDETTALVDVKTACNDGIDNDNDGLIDLQDPGCESLRDNSEYNIPLNEGKLIIQKVYIQPATVDSLTIASVKILNIGIDLKNLKVSIMIPDLGIIVKSSSFNLKQGKSIVKTITIPTPNEKGEYIIKIIVSNTITRHSVYRVLVVN